LIVPVTIIIPGDKTFHLSREEDDETDPPYRHASYCCVCPQCVRVWATVWVSGSLRDNSAFPKPISCRVCDKALPHAPVPGSLLQSYPFGGFDEGLLAAFPEELIEREFFLHFSAIDRMTLMLTPEDLSKLQLFRARISAGEQLPLEETREAIRLLRADRVAAAERAKTSKARGSSGSKAAKAPPRSANDLLGKLGIPGL
jgi:hypothetical protein